MLQKRPYIRATRIAPVLQQNLASILQQRYRSTDMGLLTVSHVELARDLSKAKVFISFLARPTGQPTSDTEQQHADQIANFLQHLNQQVPRIRSMLASVVQLKYVPDLRFVFDDIPSKAEKINRFLHQSGDTSR